MQYIKKFTPPFYTKFRRVQCFEYNQSKCEDNLIMPIGNIMFMLKLASIGSLPKKNLMEKLTQVWFLVYSSTFFCWNPNTFCSTFMKEQNVSGIPFTIVWTIIDQYFTTNHSVVCTKHNFFSFK